MTRQRITRRAAAAGLAALLCVLTPHASAHDFRLGPLRIDHPYATPTPAGTKTGAAYLRTLRNIGDQVLLGEPRAFEISYAVRF